MNKVTIYTDDLITIQVAQKILDVSRMTIYRWIADGKLTKYELSGSKRVFLFKGEVERLRDELLRKTS